MTAAVLLLSAAPLPRPGQTTNEFTPVESAVVVDLRGGDRPEDGKHRELPAKKPRPSTLVVQTARSATVGDVPAFRRIATADALHARQQEPRVARDPSTAARRNDPALRLHPGQAPPPVA